MSVETNGANDWMFSPFENKLPWIVSERGQPAATNPNFSSTNATFDFVGWSAKVTKVSENLQRDLMEIQALLDVVLNYRPAQHRGLIDDQDLSHFEFGKPEDGLDEVQPQHRGFIGEESPGRDAFDRLEADSGQGESNFSAFNEYEFVFNQPDAYSDFADSYYDGPVDKGPLPDILDMAA
ncbi:MULTISPECIES: hypothetical protein [Pseudomonas]|uniref:Uncharacterized protein n=1 Tax=Pseudomonas gingeri TaxID=117681 RepID=A0A7Y8BUF0_9PSED|nr:MULTISPECIES: hypothetical protein [Pseudomonas]MPQ65217.1 hypothetical protein [Pseudomonas sp. MWU12-2323]NWB88920.1 hypothetical protein [Pseudomonas gingeri]RBH58531.1 hypothetical protein C3F00_007380 [Pseudomonas sp. MWU13-2860]